jgi:DNA-binding response OmpR family regulator
MTSKIIFIVDDEPVIADTLATILAHNGFVAKAFHRPGEALRAVESTVPDLLISDVVMTGMTGIELARRVRAQYQECKILLFSGREHVRGMLRSAEDDLDFEIIQKPIHPTALLALIKKNL